MKSLYKRLSRALHAILQWLFVISLMALPGCIYLPTFEHPVRGYAQTDFRGLTGNAKSNRLIRPNAITREKIIQILGNPKYISADDRAIAYVECHRLGVWVNLWLFWNPRYIVAPAYFHAHVLRLTFDQNDILSEWKLVDDSVLDDPGNALDGVEWGDSTPWGLESELIDKLNATGSKLLPNTSPSTR